MTRNHAMHLNSGWSLQNAQYMAINHSIHLNGDCLLHNAHTSNTWLEITQYISIVTDIYGMHNSTSITVCTHTYDQ